MTFRFVSLVALLMTPAYVAAESCPSMPELNPTQVVGQFKGTSITVKELDAAISAELCNAHAEYEKKVSELRQTALDRMIERQILEAEAKKNNFKDIQALVEAKVMSQLQPPSEADMRSEFERVKDRLPPI